MGPWVTGRRAVGEAVMVVVMAVAGLEAVVAKGTRAPTKERHILEVVSLAERETPSGELEIH